MHPTLIRLAHDALTSQASDVGTCLNRMHQALACLRAQGLTEDQCQRHPVVIVWADRLGLFLRCEVITEEQAFRALETCRQLSRL